MKTRVRAFARFLIGFSPFWLPAAFLIPYCFTVPKSELAPVFNLPLLIAAVLAMGYSLILGLIVLWKGGGNQVGLPMGSLIKENLIDLIKLYGTLMLAGFWVFGCINVLKELIIDPGKMGRMLLLFPLAILVHEGMRFFSRKKMVEDQFPKEEAAALRKKWTFWAMMQSLLVLGLWLGLVAGGLILINHFGDFDAENPNTWAAILLMVGITGIGLPFLRRTEAWINQKGIIPWLSGYGYWKDLLKD